jgi:hypothetical protein
MSPRSKASKATKQRPPARRLAGRGPRAAAVGLAAVTAALALPGQALAAPAQPPSTAPQPVTANVQVSAAISLTIAQPASFAMTGVPGDTPQSLNAVSMYVLTDSITGYTVTVQAAGDLVAGGGIVQDIPAFDLSVRLSAIGTAPPGTYQAVSTSSPVAVYSQARPSAGSPGDLLAFDWKFNAPIPTVPASVYGTTMNYIATANP